MLTLGLNISHDTTASVIDDGVVKNVYYEDRCRRKKYWHPTDSQSKLTCIEHYNLATVERVAFSSYDRRQFNLKFPDLSRDRVLQSKIIKDFSSEQLSLDRILHLKDKYDFEIVYDLSQDNDIINSIKQQLITDDIYFNKTQHHYHHAVCGTYFCPFDEAIVIVWDAGGSQVYFDDWPSYREVETIFHYKENRIDPVYRKLNNRYFAKELERNFKGFQDGCTACDQPLMKVIDGTLVEFTSFASSAQNFSEMTYALGLGDDGRHAGKLMGLASYGRLMPDTQTMYTTASSVQAESFASSCRTIDTAINMIPECKNIVLSGGYSLNCTNNYKYLSEYPDYNFFVDPIPHDGGTAIGAALAC